jgi:hypothetical protein
MRRLIISILTVLFSISIVHSQEIIYTKIEKELSKDQKSAFDKAIMFLQKASGNENNADAIDYKYRKKRNSPKWELKTWEAKEQRIIAERNYQEAYSLLSQVYSSVIKNSKYESIQDKTKAHGLDNQAAEQFKAAKDILSKFQDVSKRAMENTNYEMLQNELKTSHDLKIDGIQNQIAALKINHEKANKRIDKQDLAAWKKAVSENTVASYHEYLNNNPSGKYMTKANKMIRALEVNDKNVAKNKNTNSNNNPRRNYETNNNATTKKINNTKANSNERNTNNYSSSNTEELVFKVQIAASKTILSDWILMNKAPNANSFDEYRSSTWIKYMVGKFKTYQEAAVYRDKLKNTAPDAFIVVFEKGKQVAVTEQMKM